MADVTITGLPNASALSGTERVPMDQAGTTVDASTQAIANLATAATVGLGNVNNTSDASKPVSTATQTALDGKAATSHTQAASTITGLATVATSGSYTDLSSKPALGTAAPLDVAATGDASTTQVVKGNDSRLSNARTPAAHNQAATTITGLATVATTGSAGDLTVGTLSALRLPNTAVTAGAYTYGSFTVDTTGRLTAANNGTAPLSVGTTTGTVAAGDDSRITGALSSATAATTYQPLATNLTSLGANAPSYYLARANHTGTQAASTVTGLKDQIGIACSDETTDLTTGTAKVTFRMPYAFTLTAVRVNCNLAPTVSAVEIDIKLGTTPATIFSTKPQIVVGSKTSVGGAVPGAVSTTALPDDGEITIDITQAGTGARGLKVWLIGTRA